MSSNDPSQALLAAALGGLLSVAAACSSSGSSNNASTGTVASGDTPVPATECDGGVAPSPSITTSTVAVMTQDEFSAQCQAKNGVFEVQPHCGGSNSCRGMSYDSETQTLTQHTCRATNTCAGFSCVVCN